MRVDKTVCSSSPVWLYSNSTGLILNLFLCDNVMVLECDILNRLGYLKIAVSLFFALFF